MLDISNLNEMPLKYVYDSAIKNQNQAPTPQKYLVTLFCTANC